MKLFIGNLWIQLQFIVCLILFGLLGVMLWINHQVINGDNHLKPTGDRLGLVVIAIVLINGYVLNRRGEL